MRPSAARVGVGLLLLVVLSTLTGCVHRRSVAGAAALVDLCVGYKLYEKTPEPDLTKPAEVRSYVSGLDQLTRSLDPRLQVGAAVPVRLIEELRALQQAVAHLRTAIDSAGTDAQASAALGAFASDPVVTHADADYRQFNQSVCVPQGRAA